VPTSIVTISPTKFSIFLNYWFIDMSFVIEMVTPENKHHKRVWGIMDVILIQ